MRLTRRQGIIATLGAIVGAMTGGRGEASAQWLTTGQVWKPKPTSVSIRLADAGVDGEGFSAVTVEYNGEHVTISAKEIFDALKSGGK